jgi:hypothetical protein
MKNHFTHVCLIVLLILCISDICQAKNIILFVMEQNSYNQLGGASATSTINKIRTSIQDWDNKLCPAIIPWTYPTCTTPPCQNYAVCNPLYERLQDEYVNARNNGDVLEGVIFIGRIPIPECKNIETGMVIPFDMVYMDLVNADGSRYRDIGLASPYYNSATGEYSWNYQNSYGDRLNDIWVSRIYAYDVQTIREKNVVYNENQIYQRYFDRWYARMNYSAKVPSRGFAMGGCQDLGQDVHTNLSMYMLNLKWTAEFNEQHNTSFNWASQLLAGPMGCITFGAFNNAMFPNPATTNKNARSCRYTTLPIVYGPGGTGGGSVTVPTGDSLGWEWAGVFNHSFPLASNFRDRNGGPVLQGSFFMGSLGPYWGGTNYIRSGGYGNSYHVYEDKTPASDKVNNPYGYDIGWKGKTGVWRVPITTTKTYKVYAYYTANSANCDKVNYRVMEAPRTNNVPSSVTQDFSAVVNQKVHATTNWQANWEEVKSGSPATPITMTLTAGNMFLMEISVNDGQTGTHIADAVALVNPNNTSDYIIIDDAEPANYTPTNNNPSVLFSTKGFFVCDDISRNYEDMANEYGGKGKIQTPFFCHNACHINKFNERRADPIKDKNLGSLYALGQEGLICMGTASLDWPGDNKETFFNCCVNEFDFGQAFREQAQTRFGSSSTIYALLGAGALRPKPYIQYSSLELRDKTYSTSNATVSSAQPVYLYNVKVNLNGGLVVTSKHSETVAPISPFGTYSEIKVRESSLSPTGTHTVRLTPS